MYGYCHEDNDVRGVVSENSYATLQLARIQFSAPCTDVQHHILLASDSLYGESGMRKLKNIWWFIKDFPVFFLFIAVMLIWIVGGFFMYNYAAPDIGLPTLSFWKYLVLKSLIPSGGK